MNKAKLKAAAFLGLLASAHLAWSGGADRKSAEVQARALVARMTVEEKLTQMGNSMAAIPRLDVPAYQIWGEGLHGLFSPEPATMFPQAIGMAASFDPAQVKRMGEVVATEMTAAHQRAIAQGRRTAAWTGLTAWSPNINIFRDPRWGRGQETYGEDPFLTGRMGVAYVTGAQGPDPERPNIIATPKHFAVHSGPEPGRHTDDVKVSLHDLEDTYLPAFRAAVVEGHAGSVMCAYNSINGQPACANDFLLKDRLRGSWGFDGFVVSDCDAVDDIAAKHKYAKTQGEGAAAALRAGADSDCSIFDMLGTDDVRKRYTEAYKAKLITDADLDRALVRIFTARYQLGVAGEEVSGTAPERLTKPEHRESARNAAAKSLVLLKNNGLLPLGQPASIAVVGPLADSERVLYGSYNSGITEQLVTIADGVRRAFPNAHVAVPAGSFIEGDLEPVPVSALQTEDGNPGLTASYFAEAPAGERPPYFDTVRDLFVSRATATFQAEPYQTQIEPNIDFLRIGGMENLRHRFKIVWKGYLVPSESGNYMLGLRGSTTSMLFDGKPLSKPISPFEPADAKPVTLKKGQRYAVEISAQSNGGSLASRLMWRRYSETPVDDAVKAAKGADVVVAVVGITSDLESEESARDQPGFKGGDRTSLDLPENQMALLKALKATGKKLVVVSLSGSALNLSWADKNGDAIIQAWYPGEEGGSAVADALAGRINPAGRLPVTFYKDVADLPPFNDYSMKGRTYRYFTGKPLYPFGYGLSYTRFRYGTVTVTPIEGDASNGLRVRTTVTNIGRRDGDEVAQLYLHFPGEPGTPRLALRGFQRVSIPKGQSRQVEFDLTSRDLSSVSLEGEHAVVAGQYRISVGGGQPEYAKAVQASFVVKQSKPLPP